MSKNTGSTCTEETTTINAETVSYSSIAADFAVLGLGVICGGMATDLAILAIRSLLEEYAPEISGNNTDSLGVF